MDTTGACSPTCTHHHDLDKIMENNRAWSEARRQEDPAFFQRLCKQQAPEFLWIGCADARVPANVIMGLAPGDVFTQRNVGNQAHHTDMNCMACLEYAVKELKVRTIIVCGHYGCGAVKGALTLPSKSAGLVNCWISDIREARNQHAAELQALPLEEQVDRLCELNVLRQTFHVCTSPVVQAAWDAGQELRVYGMVYALSDGIIRSLVGPLTKDTVLEHDVNEFEEHHAQIGLRAQASNAAAAVPVNVPKAASNGGAPDSDDSLASGSPGSRAPPSPGSFTEGSQLRNTAAVASAIAQHVAWGSKAPAAK